MAGRRLQNLEKQLASVDAAAVSKLLESLARTKRPEVLELLFRKSTDESFNAAPEALRRFEECVSARPKLALRHENPQLRQAAIRHAGYGKIRAAIPELSRILRKDRDLTMRHASANALGEIGHESCIPVLIQASGDSSGEVRASALHGLQKVKSVAAERAVIGFLSDSDWKLRLDAKEHLESTGWVPTSPREKALWGIALGRFDEAVAHSRDSVEALVDATLHINDAEVRRWSAVALTRLNSAWATDQLRRAARSSSTAKREAAADALTILGAATDAEGVSWHGDTETVTPAAMRESIFAAAVRMMSLLGQP